MNYCRYCQRPFSGPQEDDEVCDQCVSDPCDADYDGDRAEDWDGEPTGSCDWCGTNVYGGSDLCDQCEWQATYAPPPRRRADGTYEDGGWQAVP